MLKGRQCSPGLEPKLSVIPSKVEPAREGMQRGPASLVSGGRTRLTEFGSVHSCLVPVDLSEGHCCTRGFGHGAVCIHAGRVPGTGHRVTTVVGVVRGPGGWVPAISLADRNLLRPGNRITGRTQ